MFSSPGWIRTNDQPINSRKESTPKPYESQDLRPIGLAGRSAGRSVVATGQAEGGPPADVDLAGLVAAWPTLPEPIKAAVRALVGSARESPSIGGL